MIALIAHLVTFAHWFGTAVNLVGACVLLSRVLLLTLPKPRAGATGWYAWFIKHLWHISLSVGHLNSQL